jgi:hypothetical protein
LASRNFWDVLYFLDVHRNIFPPESIFVSGKNPVFTAPEISSQEVDLIRADRKEEDSRAKRNHALAGIKANSQKAPTPIPVAPQASAQKTVNCETAPWSSIRAIVTQKKAPNAPAWARTIGQGL